MRITQRFRFLLGFVFTLALVLSSGLCLASSNPSGGGELMPPIESIQQYSNGMSSEPAPTSSSSPSSRMLQVDVSRQQADPLPEAIIERNRAERMKPQASEAWMRPALIGQNGAVYLVVTGGDETDVLTSVHTAWARHAMIHSTAIDEQGVARMAALESLTVASESKVEFVPRGMHIMLMGLKRDLSAGQFFPLLLKFEKAGEVRVMVSIRRANGGEAATVVPPSEPVAPHHEVPSVSSSSPTPAIAPPAAPHTGH